MQKPLNFAVIGAGRFARHYIKLLQETENTRLVGIACRTSEGLENVKDISLNIKKTTDSIKLINDNKVDAVIIATPPSTHLILAQEALKAKKHLLLEKPMVASLKEAKMLNKAFSRTKSVFMVGHQYVYNDNIRFLKNKIGELGVINLVDAEHFYPGPMRNDVGCLWDAGTH